MKHELSFKTIASGSFDEVLARVSDALKEQGIGILTRIDFDEKIKEKLNKEIPRTVILGACNPKLAYEAFQKNSDVALLLPCNAVIREISKDQVSVELIKPSSLMAMMEDQDLVALSKPADDLLKSALDQI